jgi:hypothetical protein
MIGEPNKLAEEQMVEWVKDINSWDVCHQVYMNLFEGTPLAWKKIIDWSSREEVFVKRTAFSLNARIKGHLNPWILRGIAGCHCEEPQATWQSPKTEARLPRFARNDTQIRESQVSPLGWAFCTWTHGVGGQFALCQDSLEMSSPLTH